eukprot:TRINITY_DN1908_c2_g1_i2.p1 TRINITY_DN1908_c2_g1~~TRINITY_DN1908_c2_g1_i2.p1  ORF type:complete len:1296 (+),score=220.69 TRINITY_DN1908_c2_g1_i2:147-4034(+)
MSLLKTPSETGQETSQFLQLLRDCCARHGLSWDSAMQKRVPKGVSVSKSQLRGALKLAFDKLPLEGHSAPDKFALGLADALQKYNGPVVKITLRENNLTDKGAVALAAALKSSASLGVLDLSGNRIGMEGALEIAGAIVENAVAEETCKVVLDGNTTVDKELVQQLANTGKRRSGGRRKSASAASSEAGSGGARSRGASASTAGLGHSDIGDLEDDDDDDDDLLIEEKRPVNAPPPKKESPKKDVPLTLERREPAAKPGVNESRDSIGSLLGAVGAIDVEEEDGDDDLDLLLETPAKPAAAAGDRQSDLDDELDDILGDGDEAEEEQPQKPQRHTQPSHEEPTTAVVASEASQAQPAERRNSQGGKSTKSLDDSAQDTASLHYSSEEDEAKKHTHSKPPVHLHPPAQPQQQAPAQEARPVTPALQSPEYQHHHHGGDDESLTLSASPGEGRPRSRGSSRHSVASARSTKSLHAEPAHIAQQAVPQETPSHSNVARMILDETLFDADESQMPSPLPSRQPLPSSQRSVRSGSLSSSITGHETMTQHSLRELALAAGQAFAALQQPFRRDDPDSEPFDFLDPTLGQWSQTEIGSLRAQNLSSLIGRPFHGLAVLDLSCNQLTDLHGLPQTLRRLDVSRNHLHAIQGLDRCPLLEYLNLRRNGITRIDGLAHTTKLRELYLGHNQISDILNVGHLRSLVVLDLSHNRIPSAKKLRFLSLNAALRSLALAGNPFTASPPQPIELGDTTAAPASPPSYRLIAMQMLPCLEVLDGNELPGNTLRRKEAVMQFSSLSPTLQPSLTTADVTDWATTAKRYASPGRAQRQAKLIERQSTPTTGRRPNPEMSTSMTLNASAILGKGQAGTDLLDVVVSADPALRGVLISTGDQRYFGDDSSLCTEDDEENRKMLQQLREFSRRYPNTAQQWQITPSPRATAVSQLEVSVGTAPRSPQKNFVHRNIISVTEHADKLQRRAPPRAASPPRQPALSRRGSAGSSAKPTQRPAQSGTTLNAAAIVESIIMHSAVKKDDLKGKHGKPLFDISHIANSGTPGTGRASPSLARVPQRRLSAGATSTATPVNQKIERRETATTVEFRPQQKDAPSQPPRPETPPVVKARKSPPLTLEEALLGPNASVRRGSLGSGSVPKKSVSFGFLPPPRSPEASSENQPTDRPEARPEDTGGQASAAELSPNAVQDSPQTAAKLAAATRKLRGQPANEFLVRPKSSRPKQDTKDTQNPSAAPASSTTDSQGRSGRHQQPTLAARLHGDNDLTRALQKLHDAVSSSGAQSSVPIVVGGRGRN